MKEEILSVFFIRKKEFRNVTESFLCFVTNGVIDFPEEFDFCLFFNFEGERFLIITNRKNIFYNIGEDFFTFRYLSSKKIIEKTKYKACVIYSFYERKKTLNYFLSNFFIEDIDYIFVSSGISLDEILERRDYFQIIERQNIGCDFGNYLSGLSKMRKDYDYLILMNDSTIGPFIQEDLHDTNNWVNYFIENLISDESRIIGPTINCNHYYNFLSPHVQGYFLLLSFDSYKLLKKNTDLFDKIRKNKIDVILEQEIGISKFFLEKGDKITSLLPEFRKIDLKNIPSEIAGDPLWFHSQKISRKISPFEVIFTKYEKKFDNIDHRCISFFLS